MPDFLITSEGKKFKVTAPDQETALAAFADAAGIKPQDEAKPTAQGKYDAALAKIRTTQFPQMSDAQWQDYSGKVFAPDLNALSSSGTTFGLSDEISSSLGALGSGARQMTGGGGPGFSAFGDYQALEEARLALAREKEGMLGSAVEMGSSLATMGPGRAAVEAAVKGVPAAVQATPSLLRTAATSAGIGAGLGGVGGFTNSEGDIGNRTEGAVRGALGGAAVGALVPLAARGVSSAAENIASRIAANKAAEALKISPDAARFVQTRLAADDSLGPAGMSRMAAAGSEATLADAGPSARNTLDYAIQSSGKAGATARDAIGARVDRDASAITQALDKTLGVPVGQDTARAGIRTASAPARDAAYKTAYAQPIDYASEDGRTIEELLQRVPKAAIDRANAEMKVAGEKSAQIMASIADDGTVTFKTMPDVRQLDYITRALNEEAQHGVGAGAMGGQTSLGSKLGDLSRDLRDTLRLHVPAYGDALAVGQDTIRQSQAVKNGYELLSPGTTREDVAAWARTATPEEQVAAAQGIRSKIDDATATVTRTIMDGDVPAREALKTLRDLSTRANRDKVAQVIGQQKADALFAELDRATKSFELRASVADNSKTFQRQEMNRQVDAVTNPEGIISTLGRGEPVNAGKRAIQAMTGLTPERALSAKDAMLQDVVKALLAQGPDAVKAAQVIQTLGTRRQGANQIAEALMSLRGLSGPGAYLSGQQAGASQQ